LPEGFYNEIPNDKYNQAKDVTNELGFALFKDVPICPHVQYMSKDNLTLYLNNVWRPSLTVVGMDGIPQLKNSTNKLNKTASFRMSVRL